LTIGEFHRKNGTIMATKVGIIGAGGMAGYHIDGFRRGGGEVVAIADVNLEAATKVAEAHNIETVYESAEDMLDSEIDAVSVIVPNKFHAPLSIQAMEAGKHVFCEKPPAMNAAEAAEMVEVAAKYGTTLMFNFNNRARPESREMKKLIDAGTVGRINSAQAKWIRRTGIPGFGGWFTNKAMSGGGPMIDLLHMLDLAMYFMDYPEPAYVIGQTFDNFITDKNFKGPWGIPDRADGVTDVESAGHGFISFKTGQILSFQISWAEMVKREEVSVVFQGTQAGGKVERLFGTDGLDDTAIDTCELYVQEDGKSVNKVLRAEECLDMGRINSAANFIESIEGRSKPLNTPDQALILMKIIDAVYESAATGAPVAV